MVAGALGRGRDSQAGHGLSTCAPSVPPQQARAAWAHSGYQSEFGGMKNVALVLAAHGSRIDATTDAGLWKIAEAVQEQSDFANVTCAFHHGEPTFANVLDRV